MSNKRKRERRQMSAENRRLRLRVLSLERQVDELSKRPQAVVIDNGSHDDITVMLNRPNAPTIVGERYLSIVIKSPNGRESWTFRACKLLDPEVTYAETHDCYGNNDVVAVRRR